MNGVISSDGRTPADLLQQLKEVPSMEGLNLPMSSAPDRLHLASLCAASFDQRLKPSPTIPTGWLRSISASRRPSWTDWLPMVVPSLFCRQCGLEMVMSTISPKGCFSQMDLSDPAAVRGGIDLARQLLDQPDLPLFGICLGHQILGLAPGGSTFKLGYGHRGLNHPCGTSGQVEITSQNHGFALDAASRSSRIEVTHLNLNDRTVAASPASRSTGVRRSVPPGSQPWSP